MWNRGRMCTWDRDGPEDRRIRRGVIRAGASPGGELTRQSGDGDQLVSKRGL